MAVNKVEYGDTTLIDLTSDTVTKETLLIGATAHTASGENISGEFDPEIYLRKSGGDSSENIVTFTSDDDTNPSSPSSVAKLESGETHSSLFNKVSTMFKNIRYLLKMLGTTDISSIADGTVTGALADIVHDWSFNTDGVSRVRFILQQSGSIAIRLFKVDSAGVETGAYVMYLIYPTGLIAYVTVDESGKQTVVWTQSLKNGTNIEDYSFNVSADVTEDIYTVQHTGWAMIHYQFAKTKSSQFALSVNDRAVCDYISSNNNEDGMTGVMPLYLNAGDVVRVFYYSTYRMNSVRLRLRY